MTSSLPSLSPPSPLNYGRLRPSLSTGLPDPSPSRPIFLSRQFILLVLSVVFLVAASTVLAVAIAKMRQPTGHDGLPIGPSRAITLTCGQTEYPTLCVESLVAFPGAMAAGEQRDLVPISMNVTMWRVGQALMKSEGIGAREMDSYDRSAYVDCLEMLGDSVDLLNRSLSAVPALNLTAVQDGRRRSKKPLRGTAADVMTWLSAALTNQDTCVGQLSSASEELKARMSTQLQDLSELVSNALVIFAAAYGHKKYDDDVTGDPNNNRRLMSTSLSEDVLANEGYPSWLSRGDRAMLELTPASNVKADVVVSHDGSPGTVSTISSAISRAPPNSKRRFVIYVKAGTYKEGGLLIPKKKNNVWLIGDGMRQTVITGSKSVGRDKITTFDTATFAVNGEGFLARDITFVNEAGPESHQAVAIRLGNDRAVLFRCEIKGHQDTLYTYSQRHFIRDCVIYGTVDFIFGNGAAVFQQCSILARKPMAHQKCTITAQARSSPTATTGFSFHDCEIKASADLEPVKAAHPTFLGRPWQACSRVAFVRSYLGDHIDPKGWMEWAPGLPLNKLYYGEFKNHGPGAATHGRVHWPGVHPQMSKKAASKFTVGALLDGSSWLTPTGVAFQNGI